MSLSFYRFFGIEESRHHLAIEVVDGITLQVDNLSGKSERLSRLESGHIVAIDVVAVDGFDFSHIFWYGETHGRVAKQHIAQFVFIVHQVVFAFAHNLAYGEDLAVFVAKENVFCHSIVECAVVGDISQSGRRQFGYGTTIRIVVDNLAARGVAGIEARKFASCGKYKRPTAIV